MSLRTVLFAPTNKEAQVESLVQFVAQKHQDRGQKVAILRVFNVENDPLLAAGFEVKSAFSLQKAVEKTAANDTDALFESLVNLQDSFASDTDVLLVVGELHYLLGTNFNYTVATTLDADIVVVDKSLAATYNALSAQLGAFVESSLNGKNTDRLLGAVVTSNLANYLKEDWKIKNLPLLAANKEGLEFEVLDGSLLELAKAKRSLKRISPARFRSSLTGLAASNPQRIVLPEGDEPRTVRAAIICTERKIAECILLASREAVRAQADKLGLSLPPELKTIDPATVRDKYVARLVELRKAKGMTEELAKQQLEDNVVLGTMMLEANEADGLVSGAVHTTANTIRPPMQIIKTAPGASIISSVFFMLMPEEVYVYGDCAVNPNPTAAQLADIAIQSADNAKAFGLDPRVAMISYSTVNSGSGPDVDLVKEATALVHEKRPDLAVDGPLQYDAAVTPEVAALKAPQSPVAGKANVFVFPDLSCGNPLYKAVQRSADVVSIGPMLQGMRKPVNDLSRGALVEDIVYTICLTAVQAINAQK
ncbi:phosphate acetyltransferase [Psittacicella melopsittaci]|uniref:Phosphate acetyltransferase n=1 Tax=Psittacicella melopsittaci TaxID=2028576 RepID=A0A3A1Y2C3_9GAMM|nr:phosphate acetyltransferase [Psittacicella melopsittaci]